VCREARREILPGMSIGRPGLTTALYDSMTIRPRIGAFGDDDYSLTLDTPDQAGVAVENDPPGTHYLEFNSDETINHFHTSWWNSFHQAVDNDRDAAKAMIEGKRTIVTGLVGLDCGHTCSSEIHPVWALAINVSDNPNDDVWAMFVRNWGDEGFCGRGQHQLFLPGDQYVFRLPWRPGASSVAVIGSEFKGRSSFWITVESVVNEGVTVTFPMPDPKNGQRINGELHLRWQ
jgi:hypothetical protein